MTRNIIVTAPGSDIGTEIIPHLIEQGYFVVGMGREHSRDVSNKWPSEQFKFISCKYLDPESMDRAFQEARGMISVLHGFIHLVGGSLVSKPLDDLTYGEFSEVLSVNLDSTFIAAQHAYRWMKENQDGNIIFFGSTTGIEPSTGKLAYGVAKAAVHNMTLSFALEGGQYNIITNTIAPGYVMTPRHAREIKEKAEQGNQTEEDIKDILRKKNPVNRIVNTEELFPAVDLLLTTTAIQGRVIEVDLGQVGIF